MGDIARASGMTYAAKDADLSRELLYRALSADESLGFAAALKIARALGVKLLAVVSLRNARGRRSAANLQSEVGRG